MSWQFLKPHFLSKYKKDQFGIIHRFTKENEHWAIHLQQTRNFILKNLPHQSTLKIAVLGSGWLLDFPMEELQNHHELFLYDICHPPQIKNKYKSFDNIHLIEKDLTFGLIDIAFKSNNPDLVLDEALKITPSNEFTRYDVVISLNLLNQLDILLIENAFSSKLPNSQVFNELRKRIQDLHLLSLPTGKSMVITDWIELHSPENKEHPAGKNLIYTQLLNDYTYQKWYWIFDTHKTYHQKNITTFEVRAFTF